MEEVGEFPFVCEECLGPDPYVRMIKSKFGAACKLTTRPFTSFKWRVRGSANGAWRHTQICIEIAKLKNCCQVCLRDMTYLVPMSLRDSVMKSNPYNVQLPSSFAGQQYFLDRKAREQEQLSNGASSFSQNALPPPPPPPPAAMLQNQFVGQPQLVPQRQSLPPPPPPPPTRQAVDVAQAPQKTSPAAEKRRLSGNEVGAGIDVPPKKRQKTWTGRVRTTMGYGNVLAKRLDDEFYVVHLDWKLARGQKAFIYTKKLMDQ